MVITEQRINYPPYRSLRSTQAERKRLVWQVIGGAMVVFVALFLFVDPVGPVLVRLNAALFFALIILIPGLYHALKTRPSYLSEFCRMNGGRFKEVYFTPRASSVIWSIVRDSTATQGIDGRQDFSQDHGNAVVRADGQSPHFSLGRLRDTSAYGGYLFITIDLPKDTPHFMIDFDKQATALSSTSVKARLGSEQRYDLEGEFADLFTVYATTANAARYATYVLTPDVMAKIIDITPQADFEFCARKLTVILRPTGAQDNWETMLQDLFNALNAVVDKLVSRVGAYGGDPGDLNVRLQWSIGGQVYRGAQKALMAQEDVAATVSMATHKGVWLTLAVVAVLMVVIVAVEVVLAVVFGWG